MNDNEERCYVAGSRAAWMSMLNTCLRELGHDKETSRAAVIEQLEETRAAVFRILSALEPGEDFEDVILPDLVARIGKHLEL